MIYKGVWFIVVVFFEGKFNIILVFLIIFKKIIFEGKIVVGVIVIGFDDCEYDFYVNCEVIVV